MLFSISDLRCFVTNGPRMEVGERENANGELGLTLPLEAVNKTMWQACASQIGCIEATAPGFVEEGGQRSEFY